MTTHGGGGGGRGILSGNQKGKERKKEKRS